MLTFQNQEIPNTGTVIFKEYQNGSVVSTTELDKIYFGSTLIWEKYKANNINLNIVNSVNNQPLTSNVIIREGFDNTSGDIVTTGSSTSPISLSPGNYTIEVQIDGFETFYNNVSVNSSTPPNQNMVVALSPTLSENQIRIVLTWGESPSDLDSHLKISNGTTISYSNPTMDGLRLDVDDTTAYGPETITIDNVNNSLVYNYIVYDYSNVSSIGVKGCEVNVYTSSGSYKFIAENVSRAWEVFNIQNGEVVPKNIYRSTI